MDKLDVALKEWELVIGSMLAGRQVVLLRKGGILEAENEFELEHRRFLFFPTFVHQDRRMVKERYREGLSSVRAEPERVEIKGWGEVAKIVEVGSRERLEELDDLHVWEKPLLDMRFAYRPERPLYLVVVRAYRLREAVVMENALEYAGCKSWVPLGRSVEVEGSEAAMGEEGFGRVVERIEGVMGR